MWHGASRRVAASHGHAHWWLGLLRLLIASHFQTAYSVTKADGMRAWGPGRVMSDRNV